MEPFPGCQTVRSVRIVKLKAPPENSAHDCAKPRFLAKSRPVSSAKPNLITVETIPTPLTIYAHAVFYLEQAEFVELTTTQERILPDVSFKKKW